MNVFGERARGWKKARKRGVSPIIATILLVAITVVLAAVLYVLVSGLTKTGANTPYSLGMTSSGATGSGANWFDTLTLSPTSGLTTSMFGLSVVSPASVTVTLAAAAGGSGCTAGSAYATGATGCNGPASGWYGVLVTSSNTIAATYLTSGGVGTWTYASGVTTVALSNSYSFVVISAAQLAGNDYTISAFSTGSSSVSGSGTL
ncbi:MAG TPA: archaellin/type IV pilin N-terminal domain-containing protein [Thermoplasmata archaeon]|nr:archaellin/type IV pilin N-terminal domain-containing protein [Thermoplasmata archaeon]